MPDPKIDPELALHGDSRNVADKYRNWTVPAIAQHLAERAFPFHIAIENYQHDYNIGSIVRSANAFNAAGVHIIGKRHWNRRGAMSTEKYLRVYHHKTISQFESWAQKQSLAIVGVDNIAGSINLAQADLPTNAILVFGQEGPGLSEEIQALCTSIVAIEQFGSTRSVNVGVAAGILMHEWVRRNIIEQEGVLLS